MNKINDKVYHGIHPDSTITPFNIPGWNSRHEVFSYVIQKIPVNTIIEVGTWLGAAAINMIRICKEKNIDPRVYCVDTWLGSSEFWTVCRDTPERNLKLKHGYPNVYVDFLKNVVSCKYEKNIIPIPNTSYTGAKILSYYRVKADIVYIDGSHEKEMVIQDILSYIGLLKQGGIMFGDDYDWYGIRHGVNHVFKKDIEIYDKRFWIYQKK